MDIVSDGDDEVPDGENKPIAMLFWVGDSDVGAHEDVNSWIWNERARRNIVEICLITLDEIWDMVKAYIPAGRKVREIIGVLEDPTPPNLTFPADYISLHSDAESQYTPARIELKKFTPLTKYDDYAEDSDAIVRNAAGVGRRRVPNRDHTFKKQKYELHVIIKRQQDTKIAVKAEYQCLFPNAGIIDSDNEDYCYIYWLKKLKPTTGPQLVKACQVVPIGCQATRLNQHLGIGRVVSKVHGLNAVQYHWETLNGQHAPAPDPAPAAPPAPPPPPPPPSVRVGSSWCEFCYLFTYSEADSGQHLSCTS
ncbi:hypothetical protein L211DRAFT_848705 [Terfezia boudieri ATCC MYA-4762]|uniref:Uncharacterized protein n=1 Tax=Terfezia boudieri ATCC MYA-4762 TaxID=1051890 RepID=A0A3N4LT80_9PEZI|nr:hypothetical protein L211DRAFT_848705 [Terfezia boudieri ATCC MYA-4762]